MPKKNKFVLEIHTHTCNLEELKQKGLEDCFENLPSNSKPVIKQFGPMAQMERERPSLNGTFIDPMKCNYCLNCGQLLVKPNK